VIAASKATQKMIIKIRRILEEGTRLFSYLPSPVAEAFFSSAGVSFSSTIDLPDLKKQQESCHPVFYPKTGKIYNIFA